MTDVFTRLGELTTRLSNAHRELAELVAAETEAKVRAYEDVAGETSTVSAADRYVTASVLPLTKDVIKLKGEVRALETEWKYLLTLVDSSGA